MSDQDLFKHHHYQNSRAGKDIFSKCSQLEEGLSQIGNKRVFGGVFAPVHDEGLHPHTRIFSPSNNQVSEYLSFDSNGYLGLQHHKSVKGAYVKAIEKYGAGTPSVPILSGSNTETKKLEKKLADFHQKEDAVIFSSTYAANVGAIVALVRPDDLVIVDRSSHASIFDGIKLSQCKNIFLFNHDSLESHERAFERARLKHPEGKILVLSDSVFSMSGDLCKLDHLSSLCTKYGAKLLLDECHATGVLGPSGKGIEEQYHYRYRSDLITSGFSKAIGLSGGFLVGPKSVTDYIRFFASSWVFSTTLSAALCSAITEAFEVIQSERFHLDKLRENQSNMFKALKSQSIKFHQTTHPIFMIDLGDEKTAFEVGEACHQNGIRAGIVTFPAVKKNAAMMRLVITSLHTADDIKECCAKLRKILPPNCLTQNSQQ